MMRQFDNIKHVLLDIEGTIAPVTFTRDTLFPYALKSLPSVLQLKWNDPEFLQYRTAFPETARASPEAFEAHVRELTEQNAKDGYFKNLQGYLFQEGYRSGAYTTPLFPDVPTHIQKWHDSGVKISVYSTGSVFAQKLLFQYVSTTQANDSKATIDLRGLIHGWFDTSNAGPKAEGSSYQMILKALDTKAEEVVFFSDNTAELIAANGTAIKTCLVDRPGNPLVELDEEGKEKFGLIRSFADIAVSGPSERRSALLNGEGRSGTAGSVDQSAEGNKKEAPLSADAGIKDEAEQNGASAAEGGNESGDKTQPPTKKRKTVRSKPKSKVDENVPRRRSQRLKKGKS